MTAVEHQKRQTKPERLLERATTPRARSATTSRAGRATIRQLLKRMHSGQLTVIDTDGSTTTYGPPDSYSGGLHPTVQVKDQRAWGAILVEGSIGLGRGYFEGWWHTESPTELIQVLIRNLEPIDELRNRISGLTGGFSDAVRQILPRTSRNKNREDIGSHYDLGNEFFQLFLDPSLTYSSAFFSEPQQSLSDASNEKYDRLLTKLGIESNHSLLEIGTGWGGFALRAAEQTNCDITTTTISAEQFAEAGQRFIAAKREKQIELLNSDWRDLQGKFDRVVSIEMIEAVDWRDYPKFFSTIERCLKPDGLVGLQAICVPHRRFHRSKNTEDFIRRFVFPGGFLPSIGAIVDAVSSSTKLQLVDVEDASAHYAETLRRWRERFDQRVIEAKQLGLDERFCRLWRFYLAYCEGAFLERHCTINQVILAGPQWRPDGLALRAV